MQQISIRDDEEPVYRQVARQLRELIASSRLVPGVKLPSVRTMASDLGVNLNTIARAYRLLEDEGFIVIRSRNGAEVAARSTRPPDQADGKLRAGLREILARLRQAGMSREGILELVTRETDSLIEP